MKKRSEIFMPWYAGRRHTGSMSLKSGPVNTTKRRPLLAGLECDPANCNNHKGACQYQEMISHHQRGGELQLRFISLQP
jgi:hypothetical protein